MHRFFFSALILMSLLVTPGALAQAPSPAAAKPQGAQAQPSKPPGEKTPNVGENLANTIPPEPSPSPTASKKKGYKYMFAIIDTSMGKIKVKLLQDKSPKTVDNFVDLAEGKKEWKDPVTFEKKKTHFYDGLTFHRIIPKFMIQGGDPEGTGMGGPGFEFADEHYPDLNFEKGGIVAMANRGPNTNGSQFFITTDPASWLNGKYSIFGEVVEGMDVVKKISQTPTDKTNDRPLKPVKINKVTIQRK